MYLFCFPWEVHIWVKPWKIVSHPSNCERRWALGCVWIQILWGFWPPPHNLRENTHRHTHIYSQQENNAVSGASLRVTVMGYAEVWDSNWIPGQRSSVLLPNTQCVWGQTPPQACKQLQLLTKEQKIKKKRAKLIFQPTVTDRDFVVNSQEAMSAPQRIKSSTKGRNWFCFWLLILVP